MTSPANAPVRVILNPASSSGKGAELRSDVERGLVDREIEFGLIETEGPGHAIELGRAAREAGIETVLAVGGDGTIHEIVQGLLEPEVRAFSGAGVPPALGVVPVGTGNDFYRMVSPRSSLDAALDVLHGGRTTPFDVGIAEWEGKRRPFVNLFGIGIDVEVLRRRQSFSRLPGLAQYLSALLSAVVRYRPFPMRVRADSAKEIRGADDGAAESDWNWEHSSDTHLAAVTVGPSAGGGFLLSPEALPDDRALDLFFIEGLSYGQIIRYIPRVIRGTHAGLDVVRMTRIQRARFERPDGRPFHFQLDGELVTEQAERVDIDILPSALRVHVPPTFRSASERAGGGYGDAAGPEPGQVPGQDGGRP